MRIAALALLLAIGCAKTWHHSTKGERDFYRDKTRCQVVANQATTGTRDPYGFAAQRVFNECMYGEGWTPDDD